ncbi:MAG: EpsG family protein [Cetobacterium sp.]
MLIYWIILLGLVLSSVYDVFSENTIRKARLYKLCLGVLVLFFGFRGFVGWDWYFYYPTFMENSYTYEPGYMLFNNLTGLLYKNYHFFIFVNSLVDFIFIYFIFKRWSNYPILTLLMFFGIQGIPMEIDLLRNLKSILLFLLSLQYIEHRKPIKFLLLNLVAISFHSSALVYLPMYFILPLKLNRKVILSFFILGNIYYLMDMKFLIKIIEQMGQIGKNYVSVIPNGFSNEFNIFYSERVVLFLLAFLYSRDRIIQNSLYIWVAIFLFTNELSIASVRLGILFVYSVWFILSELPSITENKLVKSIFLGIAFFFAIFRFYNHISFSGVKIAYPYENILYELEEETYESNLEKVIKARGKVDEGTGRELLLQY